MNGVGNLSGPLIVQIVKVYLYYLIQNVIIMFWMLAILVMKEKYL